MWKGVLPSLCRSPVLSRTGNNMVSPCVLALPSGLFGWGVGVKPIGLWCRMHTPVANNSVFCMTYMLHAVSESDMNMYVSGAQGSIHVQSIKISVYGKTRKKAIQNFAQRLTLPVGILER